MCGVRVGYVRVSLPTSFNLLGWYPMTIFLLLFFTFLPPLLQPSFGGLESSVSVVPVSKNRASPKPDLIFLEPGYGSV